MDTPPTLLNRLIAALDWAHKRRVRIIVKENDVRVTIYFTGDEKASGVQVLLAIVNAIEAAKKGQTDRLETTIKDHERIKDIDYSDVDDIIK